jgi:hypothetical protein
VFIEKFPLRPKVRRVGWSGAAKQRKKGLLRLTARGDLESLSWFHARGGLGAA